MKELVFCLEELSARRFLEGVVSRMNPKEVPVRYVVFEGKQDLEKNLERRIRGYRNPNASFIIMRDQDTNNDCKKIKQRLVATCQNAGRPDSIVRIACRELEAFYWGDLAAVSQALEIAGLDTLSRRSRYRDSDSISNPAKELANVTKGIYQKVIASELIGRIISIEECSSRSFQALREAIAHTVA